MKKLRITVFTIIFALVMSGISASSVFAKEAVSTADRVKDGKIVITEIEITDLDEPAAGTLLDDTAKIVSLKDGRPDGISWEIPVIWVDASGNQVTVASDTKCYPVFIFYVPDGYSLDGIDFQKGINIRFPAFVSSLYGSSSGMISVSDPMLGISYITGLVTDIETTESSEYSDEPDTGNDFSSQLNYYAQLLNLINNGNVDQGLLVTSDTIDEGHDSHEQEKSSVEQEGTSGKEEAEQEDASGKKETETEEGRDETKPKEDDDPGKGEDPGEGEQEKEIDVVAVHCSEDAVNALGEDFLKWLVNTVKNTVEPQAVNLLVDSFPAFQTAVAQNELGKEIGLFVYYNTADTALAYTEADMNGRAMEYRIAVNSSSFSDVYYDSETGEYSLGEASRALLDNTVTHEMMHTFMYDYTRQGMMGVDDLGNYSPDEYYPDWFVEGVASMVESNYQYRQDNFKTLGYDNGSNSYTVEKLKDSYSPGDFVTGILAGGTTGTYVSGYLASMYLSNLAALFTDNVVVTDDGYSSEALRSGLDYILSELHIGNTLDSIIASISVKDGVPLYQSLDEYQSDFLADDDEDSLNFCVGLLNYFNRLCTDEYTTNGSVLYDFDRVYHSPLNDEETEPVAYTVADTMDRVPSTVNASPLMVSGSEGEVIDFPDVHSVAAKEASEDIDSQEEVTPQVENTVLDISAVQEESIVQEDNAVPVETELVLEAVVTEELSIPETTEATEVAASPIDSLVVEDAVTVPEETISVPEEAVTVPEETISVPEKAGVQEEATDNQEVTVQEEDVAQEDNSVSEEIEGPVE